MAASVNDKISQGTSSATGRAVTSSLSAPGHTIAGTSITISTTTNWPTVSGIHFTIYETTTVGNLTVKDTSTQTDWKGTLSGSTISNMTITGGTDRDYSAGAIVELTFTARAAKDLYDLITAEHNQDGTHGAVTATSVTATGNITAANFVTTGGADTNGWTVGLGAPDTVAANGNRSYTLTYNSTDKTSIVSAGMRLRTTRTVAAPTQCTSLNGTTQYYSKSSPNKLTFTDDFVVSAWVKMTAYQSSHIVSRYNGTSGWSLDVNASGQIALTGFNGGASNLRLVQSYQSIPLNKWVHVAAQLDMSTYTATTTTCYVMIDGVDVPCSLGTSGTNPTSLIQAGNLEIGSRNGGLEPFSGKIAQVAIYNAKVTQANIKATISQGLTGSETSLASAYSFNNSIADLNTSTPNDLTANGSAVATNADSPFGGQADGTISSTLDYAIIQKATFSTNTTLTVQVPEGCTIPTTGGVSAVSYSTQKTPYGFPAQTGKWRVNLLWRTQVNSVSNATYAAYTGLTLIAPAGEWNVGFDFGFFSQTNTDVGWALSSTSQAGVAIAAVDNRLAARITSPSASTTINQAYVVQDFSHATATTYQMYQIGATTSAGILGSSTKCEIFAECALL